MSLCTVEYSAGFSWPSAPRAEEDGEILAGVEQQATTCSPASAAIENLYAFFCWFNRCLDKECLAVVAKQSVIE